jgi:DNA-binding SARP family transcriptional activator
MKPVPTVDLRLFGSPSLSIDGVILSGRAAQRHRLALLALLALSPGCRLSREKLLAYLWPNATPIAAEISSRSRRMCCARR